MLKWHYRVCAIALEMAAQQVEMCSDKPSHLCQQPCQRSREEDLDLQRLWAGVEGSVRQQERCDVEAADRREISQGQCWSPQAQC